jgi:hypothetical protein
VVGELMHDRQQFAASLVIAVFLLVVGFSGLFWPDRLRAYALKNSASRVAQFNPFLNWMKTSQYIWSLRIVGVLSISMSVLILLVLFRGLK